VSTEKARFGEPDHMPAAILRVELSIKNLAISSIFSALQPSSDGEAKGKNCVASAMTFEVRIEISLYREFESADPLD